MSLLIGWVRLKRMALGKYLYRNVFATLLYYTSHSFTILPTPCSRGSRAKWQHFAAITSWPQNSIEGGYPIKTESLIYTEILKDTGLQRANFFGLLDTIRGLRPPVCDWMTVCGSWLKDKETSIALSLLISIFSLSHCVQINWDFPVTLQ